MLSCNPTSESARLDIWLNFSWALGVLDRCFSMFAMWSLVNITAALPMLCCNPTSESARLDIRRKFSSALCALFRCYSMFAMWSLVNITTFLWCYVVTLPLSQQGWTSGGSSPEHRVYWTDVSSCLPCGAWWTPWLPSPPHLNCQSIKKKVQSSNQQILHEIETCSHDSWV